MDVLTAYALSQLGNKSDKKWERLKQYLKDYKELKGYPDWNGRYCIAISIDELLKKMDEIEKENN